MWNVLFVAVACWLSEMVYRVSKDVTDRSDASCQSFAASGLSIGEILIAGEWYRLLLEVLPG